MVPAGVRSAGYRSLVRRGRNRLRIEAQDAWDRFVASDPGLARLFKGLRAVVAVGTTIVVQLLVAAALGVGGQTRVLHLMLGALIAMNMSTLVRPGRRRALARSGAWAPVAASLGATLAIVTDPVTWLALGLFVVVCFAATWVRRYGPGWFAAGFITWQAYFFTLYLDPPLKALPGLLLATVVSTTWVTLLLLTVLFHNPETRLRRTVTALRARARATVSHCLDLLRDPTDERRVRTLRAQLVKLSEVALLFDGQLGDTRALPSGSSAARLRRWIVEVEISCEELANATLELADLARTEALPAGTHTAVVRALEVLGWGEVDAANLALDELRRPPHWEHRPVRRLANAAQTLVDSVSAWMSGEILRTDDTSEPEYEQVLTLAGDILPGTTPLQPETRSRWAPAAWSTTTRQAIQAGAAAALAIVAGELISPQRYYWAVIAAFVCFTGTANAGETVRKSIARIGGTVAGLVAAVWLGEVTLGHSAITLAILLACIFLAFYLQAISYAAMIFFITLMLGELYGILHRFNDSVLLLRLAETAAGAAAGIAVSLVLMPSSPMRALIAARRSLLDHLAHLADGCAQRMRGEEHEPGLLADAVRLEEAARQLARNADSIVRVPGFDHDQDGRRHRVHVLGVCATAARSLVPAVLAAPPDPPVQLARACEAIATEARRLGALANLRDQSADAVEGPDVAEQVAATLDDAVDPPIVVVRRIQRLADALALLTPRGRRT
ncbi:MAG TPA: FUSC family protein [Marmoricola sp.]